MKDRLLTLALALGALAAFYVVLAPKPPMPQETVTRPLSTEAGPNGYLGLQRWLASEGIAVVSLRERYGGLSAMTPGVSSGNLLITTAPHVYPLRSSEAEPLQTWIEAGNTLFVLAGLSDTPEWSMGEGQDAGFIAHLKAMTGLTFTQIPDPAPQQEGEAKKDDAKEDAARRRRPETAERPRRLARSDASHRAAANRVCAQRRASAARRRAVGRGGFRVSQRSLAGFVRSRRTAGARQRSRLGHAGIVADAVR